MTQKHRELPYIKYDVNYWTAHTYMLDLRERGAWLSLMSLYTQIGPLPSDLDTIIKLLHLTKRDGVVVQKVLDKLFVHQDGWYVQDRLQFEIDRIRTESKKQSVRALQRDYSKVERNQSETDVKVERVCSEIEVKVKRKGIDDPLQAPIHAGVVMPVEEFNNFNKLNQLNQFNNLNQTNKLNREVEQVEQQDGLDSRMDGFNGKAVGSSTPVGFGKKDLAKYQTKLVGIVGSIYESVEKNGLDSLVGRQVELYEQYNDPRVPHQQTTMFHQTKEDLLKTPQPTNHLSYYDSNGWYWISNA